MLNKKAASALYTDCFRERKNEIQKKFGEMKPKNYKNAESGHNKQANQRHFSPQIPRTRQFTKQRISERSIQSTGKYVTRWLAAGVRYRQPSTFSSATHMAFSNRGAVDY